MNSYYRNVLINVLKGLGALIAVLVVCVNAICDGASGRH